MMNRLSLLLLCGLLSHVNAQGAVCKGPCQSLTSKIEGGTVATLALINIVTSKGIFILFRY